VDSWNKEISVGNAGLTHPNVLQIIGCGKDKIVYEDGSESGMKIYTVTEIADSGELFDFVQEVG